MNDDVRYCSGTSLERTRKEEILDAIDGCIPEDMSDELYLGLKKLTQGQLKELLRLLDNRVGR